MRALTPSERANVVTLEEDRAALARMRANVREARIRATLTDRTGTAGVAAAAGAFGDLEAGEEFMLESASVPLVSQVSSQAFAMDDKYRPRKPQYVNKVRTGFDWTKYNQAHYDKDNPPPKIVQGYRFNIFYPDLIDPSKPPSYRLEPDPEGNPDMCIIRFMAGPPYEDLAFKIVKKKWNTARRHGFKCTFHKVVFLKMRWSTTVLAPQQLLRIFAHLQNLGTTVVVHVAPAHVRLVMTGGLKMTDGEEVFVRLPVTSDRSMFGNFVVESKRNNNIFLTVEIADMVQALRAAPVECELKLSKRDGSPCLLIDVVGESMNATQEVPVVMAKDPAQTDEDCTEPDVDEPKVKIRLPPLRVLRSVVDGLRSLSPTITLEASSLGELVVSAATQEADVKTTFHNLEYKSRPSLAAAPSNPSGAALNTTEDSEVSRSRLMVRVKKLLNVLQSRHLDVPSGGLACFVDNMCLVVYIRPFGGLASCTYYIPVVLDTPVQ